MTVPLWKTIHDDKPVVDLHIHPAMNRLVIKQNLGLRYIVSRSFNPFAVRASWPRLQDGGYGAILSVIHVPERGLLNDFPIMKLFRVLRPDLWKKLIDTPYINATLNLLNDLEKSVGESNLVQMAHSVAELEAILSQPSGQNVTQGNAGAGIVGTAALIPGAYRWSGGSPGNAYDKDIAHWEYRARLRMDFLMGKEASGTILFEADSGLWGDRAGGNPGQVSERNTYGYWGGDRAALEIKNIFFTFALPVIPVPTQMTVGLQTFAIRVPLMLLTDGIGIKTDIKVDPATISLIYAKAIENDVKASDDGDVYGIHANAKIGKIPGESVGLDLHPLDFLDVRDDLPLEQLGLDLARVWGDGRRCQLRRWLPQTPAGAGLSGQRSAPELLEVIVSDGV